MNASFNLELPDSLGPIDLNKIKDPEIKAFFKSEEKSVNTPEFKAQVDEEWELILKNIHEHMNLKGKFEVLEIFEPLIQHALISLESNSTPETYETEAVKLMAMYYALSNINEGLGKETMEEVDLALNYLQYAIQALFFGYDRGMQTVDLELMKVKFANLKKAFIKDKFTEDTRLQN